MPLAGVASSLQPDQFIIPAAKPDRFSVAEDVAPVDPGCLFEDVDIAVSCPDKIESRLGTLTPVDGGRLDGEARLYRLPDGLGDVGFISSVTEPFCDHCNRIRITAEGVRSNRSAIGARFDVRSAGTVQRRWVKSGSISLSPIRLT